MSYHKQPSAGFAGLIALIIVSFILVGCPTGSILDDLPGLLGTDSTPPTVPAGGYDFQTPTVAGEITFTWGAAEDNETAAADIVYRIVYTVDQAEAMSADATNNTFSVITGSNTLDHGKHETTGETQITLVSSDGLYPGATYYVNVLAVDSEGNFSEYEIDQQTTPAGPDPTVVDEFGDDVVATYFDFQAVPFQASESMTFKIRNDGDVPLEITGHEFTYTGTYFGLSLDRSTPYEAIDPGNTTDFVITLTVEHLSGNDYFTSDLLLTYNDPDGVGTATYSLGDDNINDITGYYY